MDLLPAGHHRPDMRQGRMAGGGQIDVDDQEGQHQEGAQGVEPRHLLEPQPGRHAVAHAAPEQVEQPGDPHQRVDHQLHAQIGQALQRVVLALHGDPVKMRLADEDPVGVVAHHGPDTIQGRDVLAPLAGGEVPEDGKHPEADQQPGRRLVHAHRGLEVGQAVHAAYAEAAEQQGDDQRRLGPVPEALEAGEKIESLAHVQCPLLRLRVAKRMAPWPSAPSSTRPARPKPKRSSSWWRSRPGSQTPSTPASRPSSAWQAAHARAISPGATIWVMGHSIDVSTKSYSPLKGCSARPVPACSALSQSKLYQKAVSLPGIATWGLSRVMCTVS